MTEGGSDDVAGDWVVGGTKATVTDYDLVQGTDGYHGFLGQRSY